MHFFGNFSYLSFVKPVWQVNYCNTGLPNLSSMSGKIPVLELLPKMLSSDMIAGFHKILYHKMNWHMNGHKGHQNIILQSRTFCIFFIMSLYIWKQYWRRIIAILDFPPQALCQAKFKFLSYRPRFSRAITTRLHDSWKSNILCWA